MTADLSLPHLAPFDESAYQHFVSAHFQDLSFLAKEEREKASAEYPRHNRFFSNGDKPLVGVVNLEGSLKLTYEGQDFVIPSGHYVFFDDNVAHSWIMKDAKISIFYYRQSAFAVPDPITQGDYCIDALFNR